MQCADTTGILPELEEQVSWFPFDCAAKTIVELVNLPTPCRDCPVYHVVHPTHVPRSSVLTALQNARLDSKRLPQHDRPKVLRASDLDERRNPSRKLAFYEGKYDDKEERAKAGLSVEKTLAVSRWLREVPVVDEGLVAKWVGAWKESGFLRQV